MKEIKLVAFDLDGTTVPMGGTEASERFCRCVAAGTQQGVVFAPFTGRTITTTPQQILDIEGIRYISYSNGAGVYDTVADRYLYRKLMPQDTALGLLRYLSQYPLLAVMVFTDGRIVMERRVYDDPEQFPLPPHHKRAVETGATMAVENLEQYLLEQQPNVDKINIVRVLGETRERIFADLARDKRIHAVSSGGVNLEINGIDTNKGNALRFLVEHLGITMENVLALGDNDNDVEMLEAAGLGIAMANSSPAARAAADRIGGAQDEDGAAEAIQQFVLDSCPVTL